MVGQPVVGPTAALRHRSRQLVFVANAGDNECLERLVEASFVRQGKDGTDPVD